MTALILIVILIFFVYDCSSIQKLSWTRVNLFNLSSRDNPSLYEIIIKQIELGGLLTDLSWEQAKLKEYRSQLKNDGDNKLEIDHTYYLSTEYKKAKIQLSVKNQLEVFMGIFIIGENNRIIKRPSGLYKTFCIDLTSLGPEHKFVLVILYPLNRSALKTINSYQFEQFMEINSSEDEECHENTKF